MCGEFGIWLVFSLIVLIAHVIMDLFICLVQLKSLSGFFLFLLELQQNCFIHARP